MSRLFVAIDLPESIKDQLLAIQTHIDGARWVNRHQLHLTLRFIGEVDHAQEQKIKTALESIAAQMMHLHLQGVGRFPTGTRQAARVLWVGLADNDTLQHLQGTVEQSLQTTGLSPEKRRFNAHITLARLNSAPPKPVEDFLAAHDNFNTDPFVINEMILFSSILSPQGAQYRRQAIYPLS